MTATWRDVLPVHPACEAGRRLSKADLVALAGDLDAQGLIVPIAIWLEPVWNADGGLVAGEWKSSLLDGQNRLDALEEAGLLAIGSKWNPQYPFLLQIDRNGCAVLMGKDREGDKELLSQSYDAEDGDPWEIAASLNLHRRHDSAGERLAHAERLARSRPGVSARQIAKEAGVSPTTAAKIVRKVEQSGDMSTVDTSITRTDTLGRSQPATKPAAPTPPAPRREPAPAEVRQARPEMLMALSRLLRLDTDRTLEEVIRVLGGARRDIGTLALEKRIAAGRGLLRALDVSADDLGPVG